MGCGLEGSPQPTRVSGGGARDTSEFKSFPAGDVRPAVGILSAAPVKGGPFRPVEGLPG